MLNEKKLREMVDKLNEQRLYNYVEWTEDDEIFGYDGDVTDGLHIKGQEFRLEEISTMTAKLYMKVDGMWMGIMVVER